jgi:hypothetical protein
MEKTSLPLQVMAGGLFMAQSMSRSHNVAAVVQCHIWVSAVTCTCLSLFEAKSGRKPLTPCSALLFVILQAVWALLLLAAACRGA